MSAKERAIELYLEHIALATTDGRLFRATVMEKLMQELNISIASAATHYNTAKKLHPVEGLGRVPLAPGVKKLSTKPVTQKVDAASIPEEDCFTVVEYTNRNGSHFVGCTQSFVLQGEASEYFDERVALWPQFNWLMIKGLGPNPGEEIKKEVEIKRHIA